MIEKNNCHATVPGQAVRTKTFIYARESHEKVSAVQRFVSPFNTEGALVFSYLEGMKQAFIAMEKYDSE